MAHPSTPPRNTLHTPALSSPVTPPPPETPYTSLPTPGTAHQLRRLDTDRAVESSVNLALGSGKLSYHDMSDSKVQPRAVQVRPEPRSPVSTGRSPTPLNALSQAHEDDLRDSASDEPNSKDLLDGAEFPTQAQLQHMQVKLDEITKSPGNAEEQRDELSEMLQTLLTVHTAQLPFLRQQVEAQQETIATLHQQANLSKAMITIERDRFAAERASWKAETRALIRARDAELAAGNRPKGLLDLDVGYHQELEAANKRLEMDNRLMAPRLVDTQQQIESLVTELRHLRTHVILDTSVFDDKSAAPRPKEASPKSSRIGPSKTNKRSTMGDARAEHLLLAAKKVRSMRAKDGQVGHLTLDELQRRGVVGPEGGVGYSEGYGGEGEDELPLSDEDERKVMASPIRDRRDSTSTKTGGTPLLPRPKKKRAVPTTPSRSRAAPQVPQTTPGGNFNDLLLAAEMATRPGTPTRRGESAHPLSVSAARTSGHTTYDSPSKKPRRQPPATVEWSSRRHVGDDGSGSPRKASATSDQHESSALDLLAQASQEVAHSSQSSSVLASAARFEGMMEGEQYGNNSQGSRSQTPLGPAIKLEGAFTPGQPPQGTPTRGFPSSSDDPFNDSTNPNLSAFQSPTGAAVPGLGKYVHLSSTMPARRVRSPYLKWTKEEDELLTRAVMEHGEKWDLVSKGVPTRSYHQVRQRWLRKTGAFDKKPATQTPTDPSPLGRATPGEQASPTPKGRKRRDA